MKTPWNTQCGNPWYGPRCTMVHAAETSPHLLHTTGCMRPTGSVPWCTPWGMPWSSWHFSHGSTHDILLSKQTHGPFHSLSDGRPMTYLPCKTFHAKKPSMDDRWVALRLNHDATLGMAHVAPWYMPLKPRHTCYIPRDACVPRDLSHGVRPGECHGHRGIFPMAPLTIFYYRNKLMALSTACPMGGP